MNDLDYLIAPAAAFFVAAASPGPATLAVSVTAMSKGRRAALVFGLGLTIGLTFWGVVAATGLGALILAWAPALIFLRLAGGAFLLWLAWKSAVSALSSTPPELTGTTAGTSFRRGVFLNLLNPKAVLAWGAVLALGLPADARPTDFALIVAICTLLGFGIYAGYAVLFAQPAARRWYRRVRRWIEGVCAGLFGLAGGRLILWRPDAA